MSTAWHLVTGEYPPTEGGVGDYVFLLANELARAGDTVHVWCPAQCGRGLDQPGVSVHAELGSLSPFDCLRAGGLLNREPGPRRLLIQWVPHAFGWRAVNVPFCLWVLSRSVVSGDRVELMVHEPFLPFGGSVRQRMAALAQRFMICLLLLAASRVWLSQPSWWHLVRPFALGRRQSVGWLPVPSNINLDADSTRVLEVRSVHPEAGRAVGHFGLFGPWKDDYFIPYLEAVADRMPDVVVVLVGFGCGKTLESVVARRPELGARIAATDGATPERAANLLASCDALILPYIDGVSSRRGSVMAGLALGIPIVTHAGASTEALWKDSGGVALAGPSPNDYADAVQALLNDDEARIRLGRRAKELYEERFHIRHVVERLRGASDIGHPVIDPAIEEFGQGQGRVPECESSSRRATGRG